MSRKLYKELRGSIHLIDNTLQDQNKQDKLLKIWPSIEVVLENCLKVEHEKVMSIDQQIIPSKTHEVEYGNSMPKSKLNDDSRCL